MTLGPQQVFKLRDLFIFYTNSLIDSGLFPSSFRTLLSALIIECYNNFITEIYCTLQTCALVLVIINDF